MSPAHDDRKTCPFCMESIRAEAVKCKYCHSSITAPGPTHDGTCPFCREQVDKQATRCRHCRSDLSGTRDSTDHDGECYFCRERIQPDARICKHCGSDVSRNPATIALLAANGSAGESCKSYDGSQSCACKVGEKCVRSQFTCTCKSAYDEVSTGLGSVDEWSKAADWMSHWSDAAAQGVGPAAGQSGVVYKEFCYPWPVLICTGTPRDGLKCRVSWQKVCVKYPVPGGAIVQ